VGRSRGKGLDCFALLCCKVTGNPVTASQIAKSYMHNKNQMQGLLGPIFLCSEASFSSSIAGKSSEDCENTCTCRGALSEPGGICRHTLLFAENQNPRGTPEARVADLPENACFEQLRPNLNAFEKATHQTFPGMTQFLQCQGYHLHGRGPLPEGTDTNETPETDERQSRPQPE
jgi:hypothetical protein